MQRLFAQRLALYTSIAVVGAAIDLWTKQIMFSWPALDPGINDEGIYWVWPDYFGFQRSLNEGAVFGMGQGMVGLFAAISVVALVAIPIWLFVYGAARDIWITIALGAITAGVIGNLYDRLGLHGLDWPKDDPTRAGTKVYAVRDFVLMQLSDDWRWANYNIADALLVGGAVLAFVRTLFAAPPETPSAATGRDD
jgi:signal peptidase II